MLFRSGVGAKVVLLVCTEVALGVGAEVVLSVCTEVELGVGAEVVLSVGTFLLKPSLCPLIRAGLQVLPFLDTLKAHFC